MRIFLFFFVLILNSCHNAPSSPTLFSGNIMTMDYRILIGSSLSIQDRAEINRVIFSTFKEIDEIYNKWNPHSELSKVNNLKAGEKLSISASLEDFLRRTDQMVVLSEGRFDPTIEPVQLLWKEHLAKGQLPQESDIQKLIPALGWDKIHLSRGILYKDHDLTRLDLGGIVKGYAVDLLVERLNLLGYPNVYVEWGGEIKASGKHPANRSWNVFISRLSDIDPAHAIDILSLNDQAVATSGDYLQRWTLGKTTYFHIIDPKTLHPLIVKPGSISSASVVASSCELADGLATILMFFPNTEEGYAWIEKISPLFPGTKFWLYSE
jgi:thiamine biosynthesis lipoprotein